MPRPWNSSAASDLIEAILGCIHREYPNQIAHVLASDRDTGTPSSLTPAFFGCYDWHSAVHAHWSLVRVARVFAAAGSGLPMERIRAVLDFSLTRANLDQERNYLAGIGREGFERPYGLAWLLALCGELQAAADDLSDVFPCLEWLDRLQPLERLAEQRLRIWLERLSWPVRTGEHSQSAFSMGLFRDWAVIRDRSESREAIDAAAERFYGSDAAYDFRWEPSGQDFLSPGLGVADLMRRVLDPIAFSQWFQSYLPTIDDDLEDWLTPVQPQDRSDGKIAHLDGLNLSRAWMLEGIADALSERSLLGCRMRELADRHAAAGMDLSARGHYSGAHWLVTFIVYFLSAPKYRHEMQSSSVTREISAADKTLTEASDRPAEPTIRLDQFLKVAGIAGTGGQAKLAIQGGEVLVNGKVESRRRRQLRSGDVVEFDGEELEVDFEPDSDQPA